MYGAELPHANDNSALCLKSRALYTMGSGSSPQIKMRYNYFNQCILFNKAIIETSQSSLGLGADFLIGVRSVGPRSFHASAVAIQNTSMT
jgi:hypothetical protein